jgi:two-component system phosphate regulon sensor histidine kinase PhoR
MKKKYLYIYLTVLIISLFSTGFFSLKIGDDYFREELFNQMIRQNTVINELYVTQRAGDSPVDAQEFVETQGQILDLRITIIDSAGVVIADSQYDPIEMGNHLFRPEVQQALRSEIGKASRYSETLEVDFYYVAIPFEEQGESKIMRLAIPLKEFRSMNERVWRNTGFVILLSAVVVTLLALVVFRQYQKTIHALTESAEEILAGNYGRTILIESDDEMRDLIKAFNQMSTELQATVEELHGQNAKLEASLNAMVNGLLAVDPEGLVLFQNQSLNQMLNQDLEVEDSVYQVLRSNTMNRMILQVVESGESIQMEQEGEFRQGQVLRFFANPIYLDEEEGLYGVLFVVQDITSIRKLEQMRSDFIANVSHELKTPITSIRGFIETIRTGAIQDPEKVDRFLHIIDQESERLYILVQDILSLSEIETMAQDTARQSFSLNDLCEEAIHLLQPASQEKGIILDYQWKGEPLAYFGNRDRIKQVLINLLDNAITYTDDGKVALLVRAEAKKVVIQVEDTGIGFGEEHQARIFERFYRVDKGRSRKRGGTGLGLSIVKNIVLLYGGRVSVDSKEGEGSCFTVELPIQEI